MEKKSFVISSSLLHSLYSVPFPGPSVFLFCAFQLRRTIFNRATNYVISTCSSPVLQKLPGSLSRNYCCEQFQLKWFVAHNIYTKTVSKTSYGREYLRYLKRIFLSGFNFWLRCAQTFHWTRRRHFDFTYSRA